MVSFTGLFIGSMIPDVEYIVVGTRTISHTLTGAFLFDLPLGVISVFFFNKIIRDKLIMNLPIFLYRRFLRFHNLDCEFYFRKNIVIILLSILLGTATHLGWDSFTHDTGYFVNHFAALKKKLV